MPAPVVLEVIDTEFVEVSGAPTPMVTVLPERVTPFADIALLNVTDDAADVRLRAPVSVEPAVVLIAPALLTVNEPSPVNAPSASGAEPLFNVTLLLELAPKLPETAPTALTPVRLALTLSPTLLWFEVIVSELAVIPPPTWSITFEELLKALTFKLTTFVPAKMLPPSVMAVPDPVLLELTFMSPVPEVNVLVTLTVEPSSVIPFAVCA